MKTLMILMTTVLAACSHATPEPKMPSTTAELAGRRAQLLAWLHDYQAAGTYPTDSLGMPRSVFVDDQGVRCPMAELIWRSGHADLVEAVARENNQVRLADIQEGPLWDWMIGSGLTLDEIAMVQGAAEWNVGWQDRESQTILAEAHGQVRGRLEVAERALRNGTAHALEVASAKLPNGRIPVTKVSGRVIPTAAIKSRPSIAAPAPLPIAEVKVSGMNERPLSRR